MGNILYYLHTNYGINSNKSSVDNYSQNLEKRSYENNFLDTSDLSEDTIIDDIEINGEVVICSYN
tara:strand:+ start:665 stop:859 length:195 start_codon:yes stop_codon:yes gene_type:complete